MAPLSPYDLRTAVGRGPEGFPAGHRWDSFPEIRFAQDSPLERRGFEPPVPLAKRVGLSDGTGSAGEAKRVVSKASPSCGGPRVRISFPPAASLLRTRFSRRQARANGARHAPAQSNLEGAPFLC